MFEEVQALNPSRFFALKTLVTPQESVPTKSIVGKKKMTLPDTSYLFNEERFAKCALCWNEQWLFFEVEVAKALEQSFFPSYRDGDSLELFIDTRNLKSAGYTTKFCHHFVILPQPVEGISAHEVTRFRLEDQRELCDPSLIDVRRESSVKSYRIQICLPSECLYHYDPIEFSQIGFTYRFNRIGGKPQHFSVSSKNIAIERHPSLWGDLQLEKEGT